MMPQQSPDTVTCPYGHTFPSSQLTVRNGQYVCPVCEGAQWANPRAQRPWSRSLLQPPFLLLAAAIVLEVGLQVTTIGLGAEYANQNLGGSGWLIANGVLSLLGTAAILVGVFALIPPVRAGEWLRRRLFLPLFLIGLGLVVSGIGGLFGIGLNLALLDVSSPGAGWQLAGQLLDALSSLALGGVGIWVAVLVRSSGEDPLPLAE